MILILAINLIVVGALVAIALTKGVEAALPFVAALMILLPFQCKITVPGLFDLTSSRIAIITFAVLYLVLGANGSGAESMQKNPLKLLMLLTIGCGLVSTANSIVFTTSLKTILSEICDYYLLYYLFSKIITKRETIHKVLQAMIAALVVCCLFGFLEIELGWSVMSLFPAVEGLAGGVLQGSVADMERGLRIRAVFPHPILFGTALALALPLALYLLSVAERGMRKASLWLIKSEDGLAGYGWTLQGHAMGSYYLPPGENDVHLFDFYVFPKHRGGGTYTLLFNYMLRSLAADGAQRAFTDVAEWNEASLSILSPELCPRFRRALIRSGGSLDPRRLPPRPTPFRQLGWARKFTIFRRTIVCWDSSSSSSS